VVLKLTVPLELKVVEAIASALAKDPVNKTALAGVDASIVPVVVAAIPRSIESVKFFMVLYAYVFDVSINAPDRQLT
jgi:hypothetical protein